MDLLAAFDQAYVETCLAYRDPRAQAPLTFLPQDPLFCDPLLLKTQAQEGRSEGPLSPDPDALFAFLTGLEDSEDDFLVLASLTTDAEQRLSMLELALQDFPKSAKLLWAYVSVKYFIKQADKDGFYHEAVARLQQLEPDNGFFALLSFEPGEPTLTDGDIHYPLLVEDDLAFIRRCAQRPRFDGYEGDGVRARLRACEGAHVPVRVASEAPYTFLPLRYLRDLLDQMEYTIETYLKTGRVQEAQEINDLLQMLVLRSLTRSPPENELPLIHMTHLAVRRSALRNDLLVANALHDAARVVRLRNEMLRIEKQECYCRLACTGLTGADLLPLPGFLKCLCRQYFTAFADYSRGRAERLRPLWSVTELPDALDNVTDAVAWVCPYSACILALAKDDRAVAPLSELLAAPENDEVLWTALWTLGEVGSKEAVESIALLLEDERGRVRLAALETLLKITGQEIRYDADDDASVRRAVETWKVRRREEQKGLPTEALQPVQPSR